MQGCFFKSDLTIYKNCQKHFTETEEHVTTFKVIKTPFQTELTSGETMSVVESGTEKNMLTRFVV